MDSTAGSGSGVASDDTKRVIAERARSVAERIFGLTPQDLERSTAAQVLLTACGLVIGTMARDGADPGVIDEAADIADAVFSGALAAGEEAKAQDGTPPA